MPKGEIVGMFTGRVCLSLMARSESAAMEKQEQCKLRRISAESHEVCTRDEVNSLPKLKKDQSRSNGKINSVSSEGGKQSKHDKSFQNFTDQEIQRKGIQTHDMRHREKIWIIRSPGTVDH
jgi:hypothetical protein